MSPDLNQNKQTWNKLERRVRGRMNAPANVRELSQALQQERVAIPAQVIHNLIQSTPERCWAVIDSLEDTLSTDVRVPQSQNTEWLNFFLDEESVNIMNFDLNQLQNEIWRTQFLLLLFLLLKFRKSNQF